MGRNGGRGVFAVTIGKIVLDGIEDQIYKSKIYVSGVEENMVKKDRLTDGEDHGAKRQSGDDPMHASELSPGEPKQRDGQKDSSDPTPPQPRLRTWNTIVLLPNTCIHLLLVDARGERQETAHDGRDVRKASNTLAPTVVVLVRERNDGEEQEDDSPGKGEPEGEEKDDGFADEKDEGPSSGGVEEFTE